MLASSVQGSRDRSWVVCCFLTGSESSHQQHESFWPRFLLRLRIFYLGAMTQLAELSRLPEHFQQLVREANPAVFTREFHELDNPARFVDILEMYSGSCGLGIMCEKARLSSVFRIETIKENSWLYFAAGWHDGIVLRPGPQPDLQYLGA